MNVQGAAGKLAVVAVLAGGLACTPCFGRQDGAAAKKANGGFRVAGVVVSAKTGEPLAQARITLVSTKDDRQGVSMVTQEDGRFEFGGLSAGKYSLQGARRGYIPAAYEQHEQYSTAIVTGGEFDTENLRLRLVPLAALTGTVTDENGEGVRQAQVRLFRESHRGGTTRTIPVMYASTDDQGTFEFAPIGPGNYYVSASGTPWYAMRSPTSAAAAENGGANVDRSLDVVYPTTFYGGATDSEGAQAIEVKAGDHAEVDIRLNPVPGLHLVVNVGSDTQRGYALPQFETRTFDTVEQGNFGGLQSWGSSNSPGVIEIAGIAPGRYSVRWPEGGSGEMKQEAEVDLKQDGQDLRALRGEPLGSVKLLMKMPKEDAAAKQVNVGLQDEHNRTVAYSQVNAKGEATFQTLSPGRYSVRMFAPGVAYSVTRLVSAETQISGDEFNLKAGESQEWTAEVASGKTSIEGFVKRNGKAASGVMVVLIPSDPETHQDLFRRDQSDLDGSFVLRDVIPGSYMVVAVEDAWGFDWSKPTLLTRYAKHGQAVTVAELMQGAVSLVDAVEVQAR